MAEPTPTLPAAGPTPGDVAFACARVLVDALVRSGITHACLSPGSRSTPLTLALSRHPGVTVHVHLDERSSAFFALGLAKSSGLPVAVACTSGTAVANLLPAVVEARMSRTPMILLTADRPPELRGTGANQTIDQVDVFGHYPVWAVDAEVPDERPSAGAAWRELGSRAVAAAVGPPGGPVHLNLPFREPLVPTGAAVDLGPGPSDDVRDMDAAAGATREPQPLELSALVDLASAESGLILAGAVDPWRPPGPVGELAAALAWPLLAEPTSGLRRPPALAAGQHLLADEEFARAHRPEVVLQLGAPPTTRAGQALVAGAATLAVVAADARGSDPSRSAALAIDADPAAVAEVLLARVNPRGPTTWLDAWAAADAAVRAAVDATLDRSEEPFEGRLARDTAAAIPDGASLVVASSMPVRDLDAYMAPRPGVRVVGNRGASGIDGFVSTVLGVAASGSPTFALAGDLSMLHDVGALIWNAGRGAAAVFVVANNDGGGVFDHLPVAELPEHERLFVTPHGMAFEATAAAAGAGYIRIERSAQVVPIIQERAALGGVQLIEIPIDRALGLARRREVREAVRAALRDR